MIAHVAAWSVVVLGQVAADPLSETQTSPALQIQSIWDFIVKGGPMMIPIGLCSLVALAVIVERLFSLRRSKVIPPGFLGNVRNLLDNGDEDMTKALAYCRANVSPVANIFAVGIKRLREPVERLEKHIEEAGQREILNLRKYLRLLVVIASISPLLGLLGTIFGMITAFQTVAASGEALGKTELLAEGIYEAMITTAAGLIVTIPTLIGYHAISARVDRLVSQMDQMTVEFVEAYAEPERLLAEAPAALPRKAAEPVGDETPAEEVMAVG